MSTVELLDRGMRCLRRGLGDIEAEEFIMTIKREKFDYTEWQQDLFDDMTIDELLEAAAAHEKEHPFEGKAVRI